MAEFNIGIIIGIIILIIMVTAFAPVISENIASADDQRSCTDPGFPNQCLDNDDGLVNWCSNESDGTTHCIDPDIPIYNTSTQLCTNASGVGVVNGSPTSVCDSIGWADGIIPYEDTGLNPMEVTLMGLIVLFLIIGGVFYFVKKADLG